MFNVHGYSHTSIDDSLRFFTQCLFIIQSFCSGFNSRISCLSGTDVQSTDVQSAPKLVFRIVTWRLYTTTKYKYCIEILLPGISRIIRRFVHTIIPIFAFFIWYYPNISVAFEWLVCSDWYCDGKHININIIITIIITKAERSQHSIAISCEDTRFLRAAKIMTDDWRHNLCRKYVESTRIFLRDFEYQIKKERKFKRRRRRESSYDNIDWL